MGCVLMWVFPSEVVQMICPYERTHRYRVMVKLVPECRITENFSERVFLSWVVIVLPSHIKMVDNIFDNSQLAVGMVVNQKWTTMFVNHNLPIFISLWLWSAPVFCTSFWGAGQCGHRERNISRSKGDLYYRMVRARDDAAWNPAVGRALKHRDDNEVLCGLSWNDDWSSAVGQFGCTRWRICCKSVAAHLKAWKMRYFALLKVAITPY